jgi:hypothetical protein
LSLHLQALAEPVGAVYDLVPDPRTRLRQELASDSVWVLAVFTLVSRKDWGADRFAIGLSHRTSTEIRYYTAAS